eukprot:14951202-Ditylum_brightwellii.AAC.1
MELLAEKTTWQIWGKYGPKTCIWHNRFIGIKAADVSKQLHNLQQHTHMMSTWMWLRSTCGRTYLYAAYMLTLK